MGESEIKKVRHGDKCYVGVYGTAYAPGPYFTEAYANYGAAAEAAYLGASNSDPRGTVYGVIDPSEHKFTLLK
jgi:hypothetical protein